MIKPELDELAVFLRKETPVRDVSIVHAPVDATGLRAVIDHGTGELYDGKPVIEVLPVWVTITDNKENWPKVLQVAETLRWEIRKQKAHKWEARNIERIESDTEYIVRVNLNIPLKVN